MSNVERLSIIVLPGMHGTGELLTAFCAALKRDRQVHVITYPPALAGYDDLTTFVAERLPSTPFVLLGESFSGPIAIEIAARNRCVAGLVLAAIFARHRFPRLFAPFATRIDPRWVPRRLIVAGLLSAGHGKALAKSLLDMLDALPDGVLRNRTHAALNVDKRLRLRDVACPILCLHGRYDRLVSKAHAEAIALAAPGSRLVMLDGPHMVLSTHADEAAQVVGQFCDGSRLSMPAKERR